MKGIYQKNRQEADLSTIHSLKHEGQQVNKQRSSSESFLSSRVSSMMNRSSTNNSMMKSRPSISSTCSVSTSNSNYDSLSVSELSVVELSNTKLTAKGKDDVENARSKSLESLDNELATTPTTSSTSSSFKSFKNRIKGTITRPKVRNNVKKQENIDVVRNNSIGKLDPPASKQTIVRRKSCLKGSNNDNIISEASGRKISTLLKRQSVIIKHVRFDPGWKAELLSLIRSNNNDFNRLHIIPSFLEYSNDLWWTQLELQCFQIENAISATSSNPLKTFKNTTSAERITES